jgi:CheY-like chemotaxis protein
VDDLLDVSRITLGTVRLKMEPVNLSAAARAAVEAIKPLATASGLSITEQYGTGPVVVNGDPLRLSQCLTNVLNNAIKFTPGPGEIRVNVCTMENEATVTITDTGVGIPTGSLERMFELFVQEQPAGQRGNSGLGIGLALTDKLVKLHGGSVEAYSDGAGRGSTFRITLPCTTGAPTAMSLPRRELSPAHGSGLRVLVVDDNVDAADTLSEMLHLAGYSVTAAYSGKAATAALKQTNPAAVLLDIGLPDVSGYDLITDLKRISPNVVVIALTGWGQDSYRKKSRDLGFHAHITKPADPDAIAKLLGELTQQEPASLAVGR